MQIRFEHGLIRDWRREDVRDLVAVANNEAIARNLEWFPHPYTESDGVAWLEQVEEMTPSTHWAIEVAERVVGGIGFGRQKGVQAHSAKLGYWLGEPYWGRGITTAAVRALIPEVMPRFGLTRLEAHVYAWNPASARVLEKAGFRLEGTLRQAAVLDGEAFDEMIFGYVEEMA